MRWVMAEYYSDRLRTLAFSFKEPNPPQHLYIYSETLYSAANHIDELQRQLAARIEQVARLTDENQKLKNVQISIEPIVY